MVMIKNGYIYSSGLRIIRITDVRQDRLDLKDKLHAGKQDDISRYVVEKRNRDVGVDLQCVCRFGQIWFGNVRDWTVNLEINMLFWNIIL
jgi:hypothetical protein